MNKEIMISIMKTGMRTIFGTDVFISFGQWSPEMQELAKDIGITNFTEQGDSKEPYSWDEMNDEAVFYLYLPYRLRAEYQDKPKEPEYEYLEIVQDMQNGRSVYAISGAGGMFASDALCYVGFVGYSSVPRNTEVPYTGPFNSERCKYVVIKKS